MSKADDARDAAEDVKRKAFVTGKPVAQLIADAAVDYEVKPEAVEAWILRDPNIDSLNNFDRLVVAKHAKDREIEARLVERARQQQLKFADLASIIDAIPPKALFFASLNVVGSAFSQTWRDWIATNSSETESARDDAYALASARFKARIESERQANAQD